MKNTQYFLDTNILVHLVRRDSIGEYLIHRYSLLITEPRPLISDVPEGELRSLAIQWGWAAQKRNQMEFLLSLFWRFTINKQSVFDTYAVIDAYSESLGLPMGKNDVWIAASSCVAEAILLTTDKDFDHLDPRFLVRDWIDPERDKKQSIN